MANNLAMEKKVQAVSVLCEGSSIRSIERVTGIHRDTVMRLGVRVGQGCAKIMNERMRGLSLQTH
jgi:transposase-like protein